MEREDIPSISWSMIMKMEDGRSRAVRVRRAAIQKREMLKELANKREEKKAMELYLSGLLLERWWSRKLPLITNSRKQT